LGKGGKFESSTGSEEEAGGALKGRQGIPLKTHGLFWNGWEPLNTETKRWKSHTVRLRFLSGGEDRNNHNGGVQIYIFQE